MIKAVHVCSFRTEPTDGHECREAVWSRGRACKTCTVKCYRAGWDAHKVKRDNEKLVRERGE